jgi:signal transduction histidine kinase
MTSRFRQPWFATALVECALFVVVVGVLGAALAIYHATGRSGRPPWWLLVLGVLAVALLLPGLRAKLAPPIRRFVLGPDRAAGFDLVTDFVARMATTLSVDDVLPRLAEVATRSAHARRGEVSVRLGGGREWRQVWPPDETNGLPVGLADEVTIAVQHGGDLIGEIGVAGAAGTSDTDRRALRQLAAPAGVALATVRLTLELRERAAELAVLADELEASRARIVEARRTERRRVLQRVSANVLPMLADVDAALQAVSQSPGRAEFATDLAEAKAAAQAALEALRNVARGIFPSLLGDAGIAAALRSWGEQRFPPVQLAVVGDDRQLRSTPAIEAALYFACVAALDSPSEGSTESERPPLARLAEPIRLTVGPGGPDSGRTEVVVSIPLGPGGEAVALETTQMISDRIGALGGTVDFDPDSNGHAQLVIRLAPEPKDDIGA